jgi:nicotinate-nucleotide pyrophosphorylase
VDYISVGTLTHAARAIDIGLEMTHVPGCSARSASR